MSELDPHLQSPARLRLMAMLSAASEVEFATLREALQVSDSVLSKHVGALTAAGYVRSRKGVHQGRRTTWISLSSQGRQSLRDHVATLRDIIANVDT